MTISLESYSEVPSSSIISNNNDMSPATPQLMSRNCQYIEDMRVNEIHNSVMRFIIL